MTARVYTNSPITNQNLLDRLTTTTTGVSTSTAFENVTAANPTPTVSTTDMSFYGGRNEESDISEAILTRRRNVSRNLFGAPTTATAEYARNKLREMVARESARWNFDFEAEKPLPGRFRWEPVADGAKNSLPPRESSTISIPKSGQPASNLIETSLGGPTQPKQRRVDSLESHREPVMVVSSASVESKVPSLQPPLGLTTIPLKRKSATATTTTTSGNRSPKLLFATSTTRNDSAGGETTPPPSPPPLNSMIPATVLVTATAVDPLDDPARKYLSTDGSRRREKQMKITVYSSVKKRRIGHGTAGAEKKAAF